MQFTHVSKVDFRIKIAQYGAYSCIALSSILFFSLSKKLSILFLIFILLALLALKKGLALFSLYLYRHEIAHATQNFKFNKSTNYSPYKREELLYLEIREALQIHNYYLLLLNGDGEIILQLTAAQRKKLPKQLTGFYIKQKGQYYELFPSN